MKRDSYERNLHMSDLLKRQLNVAEKFSSLVLITGAFYRWKTYHDKNKRKRVSLKTCFDLLRVYARYEVAEQELQRKMRWVAAYRRKVLKKNILSNLQQSVHGSKNEWTVATSHASDRMLRNVFECWYFVTQKLVKERVGQELCATMFLHLETMFNFSMSKQAFQKLVEFNQIMSKFSSFNYMIDKIWRFEQLHATLHKWKQFLIKSRNEDMRFRYLLRKVIWRWRSLVDRCIYWRQQDLKAITHWASHVYRSAFVAWKHFIEESKEFKRTQSELVLQDILEKRNKNIFGTEFKLFDTDLGFENSDTDFMHSFNRQLHSTDTFPLNSIHDDLNEIRTRHKTSPFKEWNVDFSSPDIYFNEAISNDVDRILYDNVPRWIVDKLSKIPLDSKTEDQKYQIMKDRNYSRTPDERSEFAANIPDLGQHNFEEYTSQNNETIRNRKSEFTENFPDLVQHILDKSTDTETMIDLDCYGLSKLSKKG